MTLPSFPVVPLTDKKNRIEVVKMEAYVVRTKREMSRFAALMIASFIRRKPDAVLGLATGSTPIGVYRELVRMHREEGLDFSQVRTFNLDEYLGLPKDHRQSYHYFMWRHLFRHINIKPENAYVPDGLPRDPFAFCQWYEEEIERCGGIDFLLLGIGRNGHVGFVEPDEVLIVRTSIAKLSESTVRDNARPFRSIDEVPKYAITMGIGTILSGRSILLLANGENKAEAIAKAIEGPITTYVPASLLQLHHDVTFVIETAAASQLQSRYPAVPIQKRPQAA